MSSNLLQIACLLLLAPSCFCVSSDFLKFYNHQATAPIPANFSVKYYSQKVDHFSYANSDRFEQRYIISTDHWCKGCPIFFYAGNEGDIFMFANNTGFMWEHAPSFKAMVVFVEHRYYGKSMPYGKRSFKNLTSLGFLTTEQALADFAEFIEDLKERVPGAKQSPVVMFGGSYGGMLAAWFRIKYPHLVVGSLASSAPVLQFPGIYKCNGFMEVVTKDFAGYSQNCVESVRNSWPAIRRLAKTQEGRRWLSSAFTLCKQLDENATDSFVNWIVDAWGYLAMIDYPNPADFLRPLPAYPIKHVCHHLNNPNQTDKALLQDLFKAVSVFYNFTGQTKCNSFGEVGELGLEGWSFQACTEMILPFCSDGVNDMFEKSDWNITEYSENCYKTYKVHSDVNKALLMFGGNDMESASNIIFSNGMRDPWSAGGVLQSPAAGLVALKIPHACHHEDLRATGKKDPPALRKARQQEVDIIKKWIKEYYKRKGFVPKKWIENLEN